jgi:hypothetical protein
MSCVGPDPDGDEGDEYAFSIVEMDGPVSGLLLKHDSSEWHMEWDGFRDCRPDISDRATVLLCADWARGLWIAKGSGLVAFSEMDDGYVTVDVYAGMPNMPPLWRSVDSGDGGVFDSLAHAALAAAEAAKEVGRG